MTESFRLALEAELTKAAQEVPGGFPLGLPYGMQPRIRRQLGIGGKQKGLPGMVGTVSTGLTTSTVSGVPKGMGNAPAPRPVASSLAAPKTAEAQLMAQAPKMKPMFGGQKTVKPNMAIVGKPESTPIKLAYPTEDECLDALGIGPVQELEKLVSKEASTRRLSETIETLEVLERTGDLVEKAAAVARLAELRKEAFIGNLLRAAAPIVSRVGRSKLFWGAAGTAAAGYGAGKLFKSTTDMATGMKEKRENAVPGDR